MEEMSFVCKNCGSDLFYNPKEACLTCKYCGSNFYLPTTKKDAVIVRQYSVGFHPNMLNNKLNSYKCNSCGRTYFMTTEGMSSRCPNCGNSSVSLVSEPGYCADGIIPFTISKNEAGNFLEEYLKKNHKIPKELRQLVKDQKLMAVYIPVWNFQFNMYADYAAIESVVKKGFDDLYYSYENPIFGDKSKRIKSMDECATDGEDESFLELFDESDYEKIIPYTPEYACGYRIDPITKEIHEFYDKIFDKARSEFEVQIKRELLSRKNEVSNINVNVQAKDVFFNFTYVPVYINTFTYRNKLYKLYVSGTTGRVIGKTPVSILYRVKKVVKFLGVAGMIALLYFLIKK